MRLARSPCSRTVIRVHGGVCLAFRWLRRRGVLDTLEGSVVVKAAELFGGSAVTLAVMMNFCFRIVSLFASLKDGNYEFESDIYLGIAIAARHAVRLAA